MLIKVRVIEEIIYLFINIDLFTSSVDSRYHYINHRLAKLNRYSLVNKCTDQRSEVNQTVLSGCLGLR